MKVVRNAGTERVIDLVRPWLKPGCQRAVLFACLATEVSREAVEPLAHGICAWRKALAPAGDTTCVFRDSAFVDDVAKTNLAAILEQHGIPTVRSL